MITHREDQPVKHVQVNSLINILIAIRSHFLAALIFLFGHFHSRSYVTEMLHVLENNPQSWVMRWTMGHVFDRNCRPINGVEEAFHVSRSIFKTQNMPSSFLNIWGSTQTFRHFSWYQLIQCFLVFYFILSCVVFYSKHFCAILAVHKSKCSAHSGGGGCGLYIL